MPIQEAKYIWSNGELVPWGDAKVHVMSHALHYATSVFEGMRAYETKHKGTVIFRNFDHIKRPFIPRAFTAFRSTTRLKISWRRAAPSFTKMN